MWGWPRHKCGPITEADKRPPYLLTISGESHAVSDETGKCLGCNEECPGAMFFLFLTRKLGE